MKKTYKDEFKKEAVRLVLEEKIKPCQVARDLGIPESTLSKWVTQAHPATQPGTLQESERAELLRLRKENRILQMEREILKKAADLEAKESP